MRTRHPTTALLPFARALLLAAVSCIPAFAQLELSFPPVKTFDDVGPNDRWFGTSDRMRERNITVGCQGVPVANFCPSWTGDRAQLAILIVRSLRSALSGNSEKVYVPDLEPYFVDVPRSHYAYWYIQELKYLGLTSSCYQAADGLHFCPDDPLANYMAAIFTARARRVRELSGPDPGTIGWRPTPVPPDWVPTGYSTLQRFNDVDPYWNNTWLFPWVQKAYDLIGPQMSDPNYWGYFNPNYAISRGDLSFYLVYGILGSEALSPNTQAGVYAPPPVVANPPSCVYGGMYTRNEVYTITGDVIYAAAETAVATPADTTLWISGVRANLTREGAFQYNSGPLQGQVDVTANYQNIGSGNYGNYQQSSSHMIASGACNVQLPPVPVPLNWPVSGGSGYVGPKQTLTTDPPGLQVKVDGVAHPSPYELTLQPGSSHNISVDSPQQIGGSGPLYYFRSWSDRLDQSHNVTVPTTNVMYTATFEAGTTQVYTVASSPTGLTVTVDGTNYTAPHTFTWLIGSSHTITAPSPQALGGTNYSSPSWSDGGAPAHQITAPSTSTTYTATYTPGSGQNYSYTIATSVSGLSLTIDSNTPCTSSCTFQWPAGSVHRVTTTTPQTGPGGAQYVFASWSDGGTITHLDGGTITRDITVPASATTLTANFTACPTCLPAGWSNQDIGTPYMAGSARYSVGPYGSLYIVTGPQVTNSSLQYVFRQVGGDLAIVAHLSSFDFVSTASMTGLMFRENLTTSAKYAYLIADASGAVQLQYTDNSGNTYVVGQAYWSGDIWLKLARQGNIFSASTSSDGITWTPLGSGSMTIASSAYVGLAVSATPYGEAATAYFGSVSIVDTAPPQISNVAASPITSTGATITWTTNEPADTQVDYGTNSSYGSTTTLNSSLQTGHTVALAGLSPSTTYYYRVKSRDAAGNLAQLAAGAPFVTLAAPSFYVAPISNASAETGTYTHVSATVVPQNGFTSPVNFSYDPAAWPPSIAGTFSPFTVTASSWTTAITISVLDSAAVGTYSLPIVTEGGGLRRTDYITLTVSRGSPSGGCQGTVTGISEITYYPDISTIDTYSATALDYCTAAYYDAFVAGYLYQAGTGDPIKQGSARDNPTADGYMTATASGGYDYELESDHYVVAYVAYVYNVYGQSIFRDPFGFSLMPTSPPPPGSTGSGAYTPIYTAVFVIPQYLYLGTTAVWVPTSDQTPVITSISPDTWDAGSTVTVTIGGAGFGYSGQLEVSGDGLVHPRVLDWSDTVIHASVTIDPEATPGSRAVAVISNGYGTGFITGPGQSSRSNPANVTVAGSGCSVSIANAGQKFSLGADYLTATVPLLATSNCVGTVAWTIKFSYQTSGGRGTSIAGPYQVSGNLNQTVSYSTPAGAGGRMDVSAAITVNGQTTQQAARFFIDGVQIPDQLITDRLVELYAGGARPRLMTGVAMKESSYRQFSTMALFGLQGRWPLESWDGGSHIGLMMVPTQMGDAYNWQQNTQDGVYLFANDKLARSGRYEADIRSRFPNLRALTLQEHELNALVFYGPPSVDVDVPCGSCRTGKLGPYWAPNAQGSDWVVNKDHPKAVEYVTQVLSLMK